MTHYISSFWGGSRGGWGSRMFRIGAGQPAAGCSCGRQCTCPAGAPCRCSGGCSCAGAAPRRSSLWIESGEADEYRRRAAPRFARRPPPLRRYAARRYAPARRYFIPGLAAQRPRPGYAPAPGYRPGIQFPGYGTGGTRQWPRQRWNAILSNRHGWSRFADRISGFFGCPGCTPGSRRFTNALARWQHRHGLRPSGVLTPGLWRWLQPRIGSPWWQPPGAGTAGGPQMTAPPAPQAGPPDMTPPPEDPAAASPEPAPDAPPAADGPDTPPDADAMSPAPGDSEYGVGFRRRRQYRSRRDHWPPYYSRY
jgi:hypothetical protein